jgi:uncharacterized protein (DUF2141 family)
MRSKALFLLVFWIAPLISIAQLSLTIEINDLRNNHGHVRFELNNEHKEQLAAISKTISDKKCVFIISNLKPGKYAFKFIHDENDNEKLDTNWIGIPKEGFGYSNNPNLNFGPPTFEKTIFELNESSTFKCKPKYY